MFIIVTECPLLQMPYVQIVSHLCSALTMCLRTLVHQLKSVRETCFRYQYMSRTQLRSILRCTDDVRRFVSELTNIITVVFLSDCQ